MKNRIIKGCQKKIHNTSLQTDNFIVSLSRYFKSCFCTQGLENSEKIGKYCAVSNIQQVSVFVLTSYLTKVLYLYGRVGTEYNSLTANNVRRLSFHGFLTSRSPNFIGKV